MPSDSTGPLVSDTSPERSGFAEALGIAITTTAHLDEVRANVEPVVSGPRLLLSVRRPNRSVDLLVATIAQPPPVRSERWADDTAGRAQAGTSAELSDARARVLNVVDARTTSN